MAASALPMAKVMEMVLFTLMPISWDAPISSDTARMALPVLVKRTKADRPNISTMESPSVTSVSRFTVRPPSDSERVEMTVEG